MVQGAAEDSAGPWTNADEDITVATTATTMEIRSCMWWVGKEDAVRGPIDARKSGRGATALPYAPPRSLVVRATFAQKISVIQPRLHPQQLFDARRHPGAVDPALGEPERADFGRQDEGAAHGGECEMPSASLLY